MGTLHMVGGPAPGRDERVPGTIIVTDAHGRQCSTTATSDGTFGLALHPDTYTVIGRSPRYDGGAVDCSAEHPMVVDARRITSQGFPPRIDIVCPMR
jgi:hypothetical protein